MIPYLTKKQWLIVELVAAGEINKVIARRVGTTEYVIKNYLRYIFDLTGMSTRLELAMWYVINEEEIKERYAITCSNQSNPA